MKSLKKWLVALLLPASALGQFDFNGKIQDSTGLGIEAAKVNVKFYYVGDVTDVNGNFKISNLKKGKYEISVECFGYESQSFALVIDQSSVTKNFTLHPSILSLEEVSVRAIRANEETPTTYSNLTKEELQKNNFGQDLPYLLDVTPSTVTSSDAGAGIGYTGVRIRGVDPTRTNVTLNGIPVNDAESHGVYYVNMPDFASSTNGVQIQRGVGTSTNGAAAFGASINLKTDVISKNAYGLIDNTVGSFGTMRNTIKAGTGLINKHFSMDARLSRIVSDGYIDRASSDLKSFFISAGYVGAKTVVKFNLFSGKEKTYQSWHGTPESRINGDTAAMHAYAVRNYLSQEETANLLNAGRTYNFYTYGNQTDNYQQDHYQLLFTHLFSPKWILNLSGHYTRGRGYYEEYKQDQTLADYQIADVILPNDTVSNSDLIRRRWLDNHFYGGIFSLDYKQQDLSLTIGGGANQYLGGHFGEVVWSRFASNSEVNHRYYDNDATKTEANAYVKGNYTIGAFNLYGDIQVRFVDYQFVGLEQVFGTVQNVDQRVNYTFFNPKAGITYHLNKQHQFYASYAQGNREPVRDDFTQSTPASRPKHEQLQNVEVGYQMRRKRLFVNLNYYWMHYKNQLILTGEINDVGSYNRVNVDQSYRMGAELSAGYMILKQLSVSGNLTYSQNKINRFNEYVDDYDNGGQQVIEHKNTDIAFSPNWIGAAGIQYEPKKGLAITWTTKFVGKQYLDNTSSSDRTIKAFNYHHLMVSYAFKLGFIQEVKIAGTVQNIFNQMYSSNGYTWGYIYGGQRVVENFYYPQAGRNFMLRLTLGF